MKNVLLPRLPVDGEEVPLAAETVHHLVHVRRVRSGARLSAVDGRGGRCIIEIRHVRDDSWIAIGGERLAPVMTEDGTLPPLSVYIALLKGKRSDGVVRALVELGVSRIVPIVTARTIVRGDEAGGGRVARWDRIISEACQQSGRADRPELTTPLSFDRMMGEHRERAEGVSGIALLFHEAGDDRLYGTASAPVIAAAIGPEGGFAPEECEGAAAGGWLVTGMATPVLRAETAAIAAAALVQQQRSHYNRSILGSKRSEWPAP